MQHPLVVIERRRPVSQSMEADSQNFSPHGASTPRDTHVISKVSHVTAAGQSAARTARCEKRRPVYKRGLGGERESASTRGREGIQPTTHHTHIMSAWRKAGLTYTQYISVAAKTLRSALKTELQTPHVLGRGHSEVCFTKYQKGSPVADPKPLSK